MSFRDSMSKFIREVTRSKTIHETIAKELREAHLKKLEEQRVLQQKQNEILTQIRDKQKVMGIVK